MIITPEYFFFLFKEDTPPVFIPVSFQQSSFHQSSFQFHFIPPVFIPVSFHSTSLHSSFIPPVFIPVSFHSTSLHSSFISFQQFLFEEDGFYSSFTFQCSFQFLFQLSFQFHSTSLHSSFISFQQSSFQFHFSSFCLRKTVFIPVLHFSVHSNFYFQLSFQFCSTSLVTYLW